MLRIFILVSFSIMGIENFKKKNTYFNSAVHNKVFCDDPTTKNLSVLINSRKFIK